VSPEAARIHAKRTTVLGVLNLRYITQISQELKAHSDEGVWAMVELNGKRGVNAA